MGQGIMTLFRKPADPEDGGLVPQRTLLLSQNSGSFYTKRGGTKAKHFLVPVSLQRGGVNFSLLLSFTGGPAQEVSWELNPGILAECSLPGRQGSQRRAVMENLSL